MKLNPINLNCSSSTQSDNVYMINGFMTNKSVIYEEYINYIVQILNQISMYVYNLRYLQTTLARQMKPNSSTSTFYSNYNPVPRPNGGSRNK